MNAVSTQGTGPRPTPTIEFHLKCMKWINDQGPRREAVNICYANQFWIRKYGGEVQRRKGYRILESVIKYLNDVSNDPIPTE